MSTNVNDHPSIHHNEQLEFLEANRSSQDKQIQETIFKGCFFQNGKLACFSDKVLEAYCLENSLNPQNCMFERTLTFIEDDGAGNFEEKAIKSETSFRTACANTIWQFIYKYVEGSTSERIKYTETQLTRVKNTIEG